MVGGMDEHDFSQLPPAAQAYIRELEARNRQLGERIAQLEEQFRLAQSKRFAGRPTSYFLLYIDINVDSLMHYLKGAVAVLAKLVY